jgi:hypothetical protein
LSPLGNIKVSISRFTRPRNFCLELKIAITKN